MSSSSIVIKCPDIRKLKVWKETKAATAAAPDAIPESGRRSPVLAVVGAHAAEHICNDMWGVAMERRDERIVENLTPSSSN
ncbi:hypothetical protein LINPERHAP2_LOCUS42332 [Linum perenne]